MKFGHPQAVRAVFVALVCILGGLASLSCTVVRYADDNDGGGGGGGGGFATVDVLVLVDLNRSTSNLTEQYGIIVGGLLSGLQEQDIEVRRAAMAPLHRRTGQVVPLIYAEDDPNAEFDSFAEAIAFFARDDGLAYIPDTSSGEAENMRLLGADLHKRSVYRPTTADPEGTAYFLPPADGLVVVVLSSSDRLCGYGDSECQVNGAEAADYFTATNDAGASWLDFPGETSLRPNRVFFAPIVTAENTSYSDFYNGCTELPNFPVTLIDVMEPGSSSFWGPFVDAVIDRGGQGEVVDMCEAMSSRGPTALGSIVGKIRIML